MGHRMDIVCDGPTLVLHGAFDVRSTWEVRNAIYERLESDDFDVVVDLTDVTTIDATALRLLAVATRHAWLTGHHLTVRNPGPAVRRMAHLTRLAHALEVERIAASA
jgi:anti-anti-sigma factor